MRATKEVRRYLRGRVYVDDGVLVAIDDPRDAITNWAGAGTGAVSSVMMGVTRRETNYEFPEGSDMDEKFNEFGYYLTHLGKIAVIDEVPNAVGCYRRMGAANPILYTLEKELNGPNTLTMTYFTPRSVISAFTISRAVRLFEECMSEETEAVKKTITKEERKAGRAKSREEAKAIRAAKKAEKAEIKKSQTSHNNKINK